MLDEGQPLSPTTVVGIETMNSFHNLGHDNSLSSRYPDDQEDLMLQCRLLEARAAEDRRGRQRAEDELKFAKHKIAERDKKLDANRTQLAKQQNELYALQKQLDDKTATAATLKQQVELLSKQLEQARADSARQVEQLRAVGSLSVSSRLNGSGGGAASGSTSSRERRGSVTDLINEKAKSLGLRRRMKQLQSEFEVSTRAMEHDLMYEADLHSAVTQRNLARGITPINDLLKAEASGSPMSEETPSDPTKRSGLVSFDGVRRYGRGALRFNFHEPLDLRTPQDGYIEAKVKSSAFCAEVTSLRQSMMKCAKECKATSDAALSALLFIFNEREKGSKGGCILQNPKEDFQKEVGLAMTKAKAAILELVRSFNEGLQTVLGNERRVKIAWLKEQRPVAEFGVQVEIPPPEDPRIAVMAEEISFLKERQCQIHEEHNAMARDLEMQREKAEVNTQYLQQKVFALHSAVHNALLAVFKHRFRWGPRCPNHFAPLDKSASRKRQLEVGYNIRLGEAIDLEIKSLGQFADYFVSDNLFGVDLGTASNLNAHAAPNAVGLPSGAAPGGDAKENDISQSVVLRRKEPIPMKKARVDQARRLSNQLDSMLKGERLLQDAPRTVEAANGGYGGSPAEGSLRKASPTPPPGAADPTVLQRCASTSSSQGIGSKAPASISARRAATAVASEPQSSVTGAPSPAAPGIVIRTRSQSPRQSANSAPQRTQYYDVRRPSVSPVTPSMVASLIPTTINLELDPNSVNPVQRNGACIAPPQRGARPLASRPFY